MSFLSRLITWYEEHGRDLPWRHTRDPYAIWLSEIILQQTRVSQGMSYWFRFMQAYPTVESLAAATEDEVLRLWQGLGYYSRARHLHEAARQIASLGYFPNTLAEIKTLKGVGDYTGCRHWGFCLRTARCGGGWQCLPCAGPSVWRGNTYQYDGGQA